MHYDFLPLRHYFLIIECKPVNWVSRRYIIYHCIKFFRDLKMNYEITLVLNDIKHCRSFYGFSKRNCGGTDPFYTQVNNFIWLYGPSDGSFITFSWTRALPIWYTENISSLKDFFSITFAIGSFPISALRVCPKEYALLLVTLH